jgi:uncharacterized protein (UPF0335 family)
MKQTAVEWLFENSHIVPKTELNKRKLIEQAKEMENEQQERSYSEEDLKEAFKDAYSLGFRDYLQVNFKQEKCDEWFELFKNK